MDYNSHKSLLGELDLVDDDEEPEELDQGSSGTEQPLAKRHAVDITIFIPFVLKRSKAFSPAGQIDSLNLKVLSFTAVIEPLTNTT